MAELNYSITINAPKEKVWSTMLDLETYRQWTGPFYPGSYFEGGWDKGSDIKFVAPEHGVVSGLAGRIAENIPYEYISIEYVGEVVNGEVITEGNSRSWIGSHENYRFTEANGVTQLDVSLVGQNMETEMADMFDGMWPKALHKLKEMCESNN